MSARLIPLVLCLVLFSSSGFGEKQKRKVKGKKTRSISRELRSDSGANAASRAPASMALREGRTALGLQIGVNGLMATLAGRTGTSMGIGFGAAGLLTTGLGSQSYLTFMLGYERSALGRALESGSGVIEEPESSQASQVQSSAALGVLFGYTLRRPYGGRMGWGLEGGVQYLHGLSRTQKMAESIAVPVPSHRMVMGLLGVTGTSNMNEGSYLATSLHGLLHLTGSGGLLFGARLALALQFRV